MTSKAEKRQMKDYLVSKLEGSSPNIEPMTNELVSGINSSYILVGDDGLVFLIDQVYPGDSISRLHGTAKGMGKENIAYVFLKDGKTFFRSSVAGEQGEAGLTSMRFKQRYGLSLKHYDKEQMRRMITFRPEEKFISERREILHYYQPKSEQLEESLENFKFKPVRFDYSHIPRGEFKPTDTDSARLRIWTVRSHNTSKLVLDAGYLKRKEIYDDEQIAKSNNPTTENPRFTKQ
jgi:hypothetical protein